MHKLGSRHAVLPAIALAASLVLSPTTPAQAAAPPSAATTSAATSSTATSSTATTSAAPSTTVATVIDGLARQLGTELSRPDVREPVARAVVSGPIDLATIAASAPFQRARAEANRTVLTLKGLPEQTGSVLRLRLGDASMGPALQRGAAPLVATAPTDDTATDITAYTTGGQAVRLDARSVPTQPVLVVEVDVAKVLPVGLGQLRAALAGVQPAAVRALTTGGYWATKVDTVRLRNDEEPWIKGAAEIFCIVSGFGLDGKATVDIVQMPYLDNDNTTYFPNQLLVHFRAYKYNLADVVMMEDDGDTNYQQLAQALITALLTIIDQGTYIPLVSAILAAIPGSWWTDDPDYVDSWYTLSTASSGRLNGAAGNGWMDVSPYWVAEL